MPEPYEAIEPAVPFPGRSPLEPILPPPVDEPHDDPDEPAHDEPLRDPFEGPGGGEPRRRDPDPKEPAWRDPRPVAVEVRPAMHSASDRSTASR